MFMLPNSKNEAADLATKALFLYKRNENIARRQNALERINFYRGNQMQYLEDTLKKRFSPDAIKNMQPEFFNITEMVINELATIYNDEPTRELIDGTDQDKEIYNEIIESSQINAFMRAANQYSKLCKTCLVHPVWRNGVMKYDLITPEVVDVVQSAYSPTEAEAVIYSVAYDDTNPQYDKFTANGIDTMALTGNVYVYWDKKKSILFSYESKNNADIADIRKQLGNPDDKNPYGVLPFTVLRDTYEFKTFFTESGDDLVTTNKIINEKLTELNYITFLQSFSVAVTKGLPADTSFKIGPDIAINFDPDSQNAKGGDFKWETPDAKITEMREDIEARLKRIAIKHKLPAETFSMSGNKSSGFSIEMQNLQLNRAVKGDKPIYRTFEKENFQLTKIIWNYNNPDRQFSADVKLNIDFAELESPRTQEEIDAHNALLSANGIMSKARWVMREDADLKTVEDAKERLIQIQEEIAGENQASIERMSLMMVDTENADTEADTE